VFGRSTKGGEPFFILREVGPKSAAIPEWMTQPAAAALGIHCPPRLALDCLRALRSVVDGITSASDDDPPAAARADDSEPLARKTGKDASTRHTGAGGNRSSARQQRKQ